MPDIRSPTSTGPAAHRCRDPVVDAVADYLYHHNANTHWEYPTSHETDRIIDEARQTLADFLNAGADEIAFGANMTTLTFHLARALARGWSAGDRIVVTELDHRANVDPWLAVAADRGLDVRMVRADTATGTLDWTTCAMPLPGLRSCSPSAPRRTRSAPSPTSPPRAALAREAGALTFVDAVHFAPHALVDVAAMDCDFLACSAYKFYGPHIGILYGRRALIEQLDVAEAGPVAERRCGAAGDGYAEPRGHRRRRSGGGFSGRAGRGRLASRPAGAGVCRTARARTDAAHAPLARARRRWTG